MDDGFVEILPKARPKLGAAPLTIATMERCDGAKLLSLSFPVDLFARLGGGLRVRAAWNAVTCEIRLRAAAAGPFTGYRPKKGGRVVLRLPLSPGLVVRPKRREPCPHRREGETLYLTVPPAFRGEAPAEAPPPVPAEPRTTQAPRAASPADEAAKRRAAIAAARQAVPAPSFSSPGRKTS